MPGGRLGANDGGAGAVVAAAATSVPSMSSIRPDVFVQKQEVKSLSTATRTSTLLDVVYAEDDDIDLEDLIQFSDSHSSLIWDCPAC